MTQLSKDAIFPSSMWKLKQYYSLPMCMQAKQKKHLCQGMWKPKTLTIRKTYTRMCKLNTQLANYPNQTGLLPEEDELKAAFINIFAPNWQQDFLKTGINKYSLTWEQILSKTKALEQAEVALLSHSGTANNTIVLDSTQEEAQEKCERVSMVPLALILFPPSRLQV
jgi:hypothetical protein